jgi:hypothetical protein
MLNYSASILSLANVEGAAIIGATDDVLRFTVATVMHGDASGFKNTLDKLEGKKGNAVVLGELLKTADSAARAAKKAGTDAQQAGAEVSAAFAAGWEAYKAARSNVAKASATKAATTKAAKAAEKAAEDTKMTTELAGLRHRVAELEKALAVALAERDALIGAVIPAEVITLSEVTEAATVPAKTRKVRKAA